MGAVVEQFIEERALVCKHSRIANVVGSLVAAARFTHAVLKAQAAPGAVVSDAPVEELMALHKQVRSEAREQTKFDLARPPKAWLCALRGSNAGEDRPRPLPPPLSPHWVSASASRSQRSWEQCQRARLRCEQAVVCLDADEDADEDEKLALARACCVLTLLTMLPPEWTERLNPRPAVVSMVMGN